MERVHYIKIHELFCRNIIIIIIIMDRHALLHVVDFDFDKISSLKHLSFNFSLTSLYKMS